MPYIFPKRRLRDEDVLDPVELNEDFVPTAELYSGNLDRHNLGSSINLEPKSDNANAKSGYFNHYYTEVESDPDFGSALSTYQDPTSDDANLYEVPANLSWTTVDGMIINNINTGVSVLWINAWAQYIWLGFELFKNEGAPLGNASGAHLLYLQTKMNFFSRNATLPCGVQFALRVDGVVVESTITGHSNAYERIPQPWGWTATRANVLTGAYSAAATTGLPGPVTAYDTGVAGNGPETMPIRVGAYVPVAPGAHTVELVVRRLTTPDPTMTYYAPKTATGSEQTVNTASSTLPAKDLNLRESDMIAVYNRKLHVMDMPVHPAATTTFDSVDVNTLNTEDTVGAASLGTNAIDKVRDKLNDVQEGALARGALTNTHLKSGLIEKSRGSITPLSPQILTASYPDWGSSVLAPSPSWVTAGWWTLDDGAGGFLRTGAFNNVQTQDAGYLLILANVQVTSIHNTNDSFRDLDGTLGVDTAPRMHNASLTGALALGYNYDTSSSSNQTQIIDSTRCFVNNYNVFISATSFGSGGVKHPYAYKSFKLPEQFDVALMHVIDLTDPSASTITDYNYFQVYGSIISKDDDRQLIWRRGDISYIYLRA